ncbi:hypothetical protein ACCAA_700001 [Candidatus Accumulibacter aalborgensis]|uniref:Uncharacterized protein n=1 Tax=Candidatus Accumulibacter aalborgensis TaxID=1860102 RepID=A0A1A8XWJ0_9PROT|nr:hypothetical protein ACCAA_700001 [Candidatus Accumulibacter aalborgensis]
MRKFFLATHRQAVKIRGWSPRASGLCGLVNPAVGATIRRGESFAQFRRAHNSTVKAKHILQKV